MALITATRYLAVGIAVASSFPARVSLEMIVDSNMEKPASITPRAAAIYIGRQAFALSSGHDCSHLDLNA